MNERILEAIKTLKKHQDLLQDSLKEINDKLKKLEEYKDYNESTIYDIQKSMIDASLEVGRYSIIDGEWCCYGKPMGVKAIGVDGKDGKQGLQGLPGKDGKDGKPGKDGKDGKDGIDGKNGTNGKDGIDGKDGINGETPTIRIGKVETSEEHGGAKAVLKRKKGTNEYVLDLTLPRGPQGFPGFDGKPGKDGTLVFEELTDEQKEELRGPQGIPGEQGPEGKPGKDGITPDMSDYYNKSEIDNMIGDIETMLKEV